MPTEKLLYITVLVALFAVVALAIFHQFKENTLSSQYDALMSDYIFLKNRLVNAQRDNDELQAVASAYQAENNLLRTSTEEALAQANSGLKSAVEVLEARTTIENRLRNEFVVKRLNNGDLTLKINKYSFQKIQSQPRPQIPAEFKNLIYDALNDPHTLNVLDSLLRQLKQSSNLGPNWVYDIVDVVQALYYQDDEATGLFEYPKHPIETLYDENGDCEDTSLLLATLLIMAGYDTVLFEFDNHMAVGVKCDLDTFKTAWSVNHDETTYCYLETTSKFEIGVLPKDLQNKKVLVHTI